MKYCSFDIETAGLDPQVNNILQIGVVLEDTKAQRPLSELPKFRFYVWSPKVVGSMYALNLNKWMFALLADYEKRQRVLYQTEISFDPVTNCTTYIGPHWNIATSLYAWLRDQGHEVPLDSKRLVLNVAGKNFATFDKLFLEGQVRDWNKLFKIRQRIIDPGILFIDWQNDEAVPGLQQCKERAGISGDVTHDAVDDALDVIALLRTQYS